MKEIYNKVAPNVIIHNKRLRNAQTLYEIPRIMNAAKKLAKESRTVPPSNKTKPTHPTHPAATPISSQRKANVTNVSTNVKSSNKCNYICILTIFFNCFHKCYN